MADTLAIPQLLDIGGIYPVRDGESASDFLLAMVQASAGAESAFGAPRAQGEIVPVMGNSPLFSLLGTSYGGDGLHTFAYPDLNGRTIVGGFNGEQGPGTLAMQYLIATSGGNPAPVIGMVIAFAGNFAPAGWMFADGSMLAVSENVPLFEVIGNTYGGNSAAFQLPNLSGAAAVGTGQGPGLAPVALGEGIPGAIPGLGLNYVICVEGVYPTGEGGSFPGNQPFLGQVIAFAGQQIPAGWAMCDGTLLAIAGNQALFQLIGTVYGGDGETNFALPDLRGRMMTGMPG